VTTHIRAARTCDGVWDHRAIRRIDRETLQDEITLDDPKAYARPFTVTRRYRLQPGWTIGEYVCEENNRNQVQDNGVTGFGVPPPPPPPQR
jgi:hypothetical protein